MTHLTRLTDTTEMLYRQVHPSWVRDGRPSSQAFTPTKKDADNLSVDRSTLISAEDAFTLHVQGRRLESAGTWAVTVEECENLTLGCFSSPTTSPPDIVDDPAHANIDFSGLPSRGRKEAAGALLAKFAVTRGCAYLSSPAS
jgi:hypothetical protein